MQRYQKSALQLNQLHNRDCVIPYSLDYLPAHSTTSPSGSNAQHKHSYLTFAVATTTALSVPTNATSVIANGIPPILSKLLGKLVAWSILTWLLSQGNRARTGMTQ